MKRITITFLICSMLAVLLVAGCAKQPTEEINAAKTAVDTVMAEGAEKYAPEDAKMVTDTMTAAMEEIKCLSQEVYQSPASDRTVHTSSLFCEGYSVPCKITVTGRGANRPQSSCANGEISVMISYSYSGEP